MKRIIAYIMLLVMCGSSALIAQSNANSELKLRAGNSFREVDYTYISPWMLQSMRQKDLADLKDIPVDKVNHIEILKTKTQGRNSQFRYIVNQLSDEPGFKMVGYNKDNGRGVKICVDSHERQDSIGKTSEEINRILVIQWANDGDQHTVVYIVGDFTQKDVSSLFHF